MRLFWCASHMDGKRRRALEDGNEQTRPCRGTGCFIYVQHDGEPMHKLLRIIYGVLKTQTPYDPQVDRDNRQRSQEKQQEHQRETTCKKNAQKTTRHRYMSEEPDSTEHAPISRRAYKKRKQEASQSSSVEEHAGSPPVDNLK